MCIRDRIELDLDGDVVHNVKFTGGCNGNLKAIPKLVEGLTDVYKRQPLRSTKSPDGIVTSSSLSTAPISMLAWCLVCLLYTSLRIWHIMGA